jgi:hypothetical protein
VFPVYGLGFMVCPNQQGKHVHYIALLDFPVDFPFWDVGTILGRGNHFGTWSPEVKPHVLLTSGDPQEFRV